MKCKISLLKIILLHYYLLNYLNSPPCERNSSLRMKMHPIQQDRVKIHKKNKGNQKILKGKEGRARYDAGIRGTYSTTCFCFLDRGWPQTWLKCSDTHGEKETASKICSELERRRVRPRHAFKNGSVCYSAERSLLPLKRPKAYTSLLSPSLSQQCLGCQSFPQWCRGDIMINIPDKYRKSALQENKMLQKTAVFASNQVTAKVTPRD